MLCAEMQVSGVNCVSARVRRDARQMVLGWRRHVFGPLWMIVWLGVLVASLSSWSAGSAARTGQRDVQAISSTIATLAAK